MFEDVTMATSSFFQLLNNVTKVQLIEKLIEKFEADESKQCWRAVSSRFGWKLGRVLQVLVANWI